MVFYAGDFIHTVVECLHNARDLYVPGTWGQRKSTVKLRMSDTQSELSGHIVIVRSLVYLPGLS